VNGDDLDSDQYWWTSDDVCDKQVDPQSQGWVIKGAFSSEVENRTYTILCDGSVNGVPLTSDEEPTNNRKKRKRKQEAAARRKKRKQNKKKDN
jgi:hypothetical protein